MLVSRIFPLRKFQDFPLPAQILSQSSNYISKKDNSFVIIGDRMTCKSSLLFQAALTVASKEEQVVYICPQQFTSRPQPVQEMPPQSPAITEHIKMIYISSSQEFIQYLSHFHITGSLPAAIVVDDFYFYVDQLEQENGTEQALATLCALLQDTIGFLSEKRGQHCELYMAMTSPKMQKQSIVPVCKRFFRDIWCATIDHSSASSTSALSSGRSYFLSTTYAPAVRIFYHVEKEVIVMDKITRLSNVKTVALNT